MIDDPRYPLKWTGERIIPEEGRYMFQRHLQAYQFSVNFCRERVILDAGCGEGYGSYLLSDAAARVIGIDKSEEAINHCKEKYVRQNLEYRAMDVRSMDLADGLFDVAVSFQAIEHLGDAQKFINELRRVLKKGGSAIIGTPNKSLCEGPAGKYHAKEYRYNEFRDLLNTYFSNVEYYGVHLKNSRDTHRLSFLDSAVKFDIFKIRKLFPSKLRKKVTLLIEKAISLDISKRNLETALDIIGVCKKD